MKIELGVKNCLYPLPTVLVGALVEGKPNYITIAHVGIMDLESVEGFAVLGLHPKCCIGEKSATVRSNFIDRADAVYQKWAWMLLDIFVVF